MPLLRDLKNQAENLKNTTDTEHPKNDSRVPDVIIPKSPKKKEKGGCNFTLGVTLTSAGTVTCATSLVALVTLSSLISPAPIEGVLACCLLLTAALTAVGSICVHSARTGKSVREVFLGSDKESGKSSTPDLSS